MLGEVKVPQRQGVTRGLCSHGAPMKTKTLEFPGFVDVHVHFRDPGVPAAETTATGLAAARCGGFAAVVTMPNTTPACDSVAVMDGQRKAAEAVRCGGAADDVPLLFPSACLTKGRLGREVADLEALAAADEQQLMALWQGLGYYSRARNLQRAARVIVEEHGGVFPDTYEGLTALPGVGDYTAGAIASIAFGRPVPAVDGNVLRLAARLAGHDGNVLEPKVRALFRQWMAEVIPHDRPGAFNQALMDLGAMICLPNGEPLCGDCPARDFCAAREKGFQRQLPVREKNTAKPTEQLTVFLLRQGETTAVRQRPGKGLLAGLWEFPNVPGALTEPQAAAQLSQWGLTPHLWGKSFTEKHVFTHIIWEMAVFTLNVQGEGPPEWVWRTGAEREKYPMPTAFGKVEK